jgi:pyruvate formate lyase activating enzyme
LKREKVDVNDDIKGVIFNIQGYSIHDGPGIRTIIFIKGCPLRCLWCDNPESQNSYIEVEFFQDKCIQCGQCLTVCDYGAINEDVLCDPALKIDRLLCKQSFTCADICPTQALSRSGEVYTVSKLMEQVLKDAPFWRRSGGGITLSGGDPLAQPLFSRGIFQECYNRNIHTAIETTGYATTQTYLHVIELVDLILFDLKHMDSDVHKQLCGVPNDLILANLKESVEMEKAVIIRVPSIPNYNLTPSNITATVQLAKELGIQNIHFLPFHQLGKDKYARLGRDYTLNNLQTLSYTDQQILRAVEIAQSYGLTAQVGG